MPTIELGRLGSWRSVVLTRINSLQCDVSALREAHADREQLIVIESAAAMLTSACEATTCRRRRIRTWWSGVWIERAWRCVHEAEALLAPLHPLRRMRVGYPDLFESARHVLRPSDPRRAAIESWFSPAALEKAADGDEKARYLAALRWVNSESDKAHARVRSFRNVVIATTMAMTLVAIGLILVGAFARGALPVCVEPSEGDPTVVADQPTEERICPTGGSRPSAGDVPLVAFVGVVGAALAAALAIRKIRGTNTPYSIPLAMAGLKLPTGAVTALAGLLLIQGKFVPGLSRLDDPAQVLSYSIILGFGQEAFTRLVDRQGQQILESAPGRDRLASPPATEHPNTAPEPTAPAIVPAPTT